MTATPSGMFCTHRDGKDYCADRWFCNCSCHIDGSRPVRRAGILRRAWAWIVEAETDRLNRETLIDDAIARANHQPTAEEHRAFVNAIHEVKHIPLPTPTA